MTLPISPEHAVYAVPTVPVARISPDGTRIAYVHTQVNSETGKSESQIWLSDIDGGNGRQLTQVGTANADPIWSPDGATLAFVTKRDGDKPWAIALLGFSGGEARVLTQHDTRPADISFSPDGASIAYTKPVDPENPEETPRDPKAAAKVRVVKRIDYKQDGIGFVNDIRTQLFTVDVASSGRRQLTSEGVDHASPMWSPDGKSLAVLLPFMNGMRARFGLLDIESGELKSYGDDTGTVGLLSWSPDGTQLIFAGQQFASPHGDLTLFDVSTAAFRKVLDNPDFLVDGSSFSQSAPVWLDASTVLVHGVRKGRSGLWTVDIASGTPTELAMWDSIHSGLSLNDGGTIVVQTVADLIGVSGIVTVDIANGTRAVILNAAAEAFATSPVAQWEQVTVDRGDYEIDGWLLKPADFDPGKRYPFVLQIHGGPHGFYSFAYNATAEVLATNGFIVLTPNPRGSNTYGRDFAEAVHNDWGGEDWKDLQAIVDKVLERPYIDSERTGVGGYSYGGYMTSWILGHTDRFKAAIVGAPCFDLESFFGTSDIGHTFGPSQNGGTPWEIREQMAAQSPSTFIHNAVTPTLIVHGEADERCPIGQGEQLFISLKKLGVEAEFVRYPGGFHGFVSTGEPAHRIDYLTRTLAWYKKYLGDPA